jgi:hypothetical protein
VQTTTSRFALQSPEHSEALLARAKAIFEMALVDTVPERRLSRTIQVLFLYLRMFVILDAVAGEEDVMQCCVLLVGMLTAVMQRPEAKTPHNLDMLAYAYFHLGTIAMDNQERLLETIVLRLRILEYSTLSELLRTQANAKRMTLVRIWKCLSNLMDATYEFGRSDHMILFKLLAGDIVWNDGALDEFEGLSLVDLSLDAATSFEMDGDCEGAALLLEEAAEMSEKILRRDIQGRETTQVIRGPLKNVARLGTSLRDSAKMNSLVGQRDVALQLINKLKQVDAMCGLDMVEEDKFVAQARQVYDATAALQPDQLATYRTDWLNASAYFDPMIPIRRMAGLLCDKEVDLNRQLNSFSAILSAQGLFHSHLASASKSLVGSLAPVKSKMKSMNDLVGLYFPSLLETIKATSMANVRTVCGDPEGRPPRNAIRAAGRSAPCIFPRHLGCPHCARCAHRRKGNT